MIKASQVSKGTNLNVFPCKSTNAGQLPKLLRRSVPLPFTLELEGCKPSLIFNLVATCFSNSNQDDDTLINHSQHEETKSEGSNKSQNHPTDRIITLDRELTRLLHGHVLTVPEALEEQLRWIWMLLFLTLISLFCVLFIFETNLLFAPIISSIPLPFFKTPPSSWFHPPLFFLLFCFIVSLFLLTRVHRFLGNLLTQPTAFVTVQTRLWLQFIHILMSLLQVTLSVSAISFLGQFVFPGLFPLLVPLLSVSLFLYDTAPGLTFDSTSLVTAVVQWHPQTDSDATATTTVNENGSPTCNPTHRNDTHKEDMEERETYGLGLMDKGVIRVLFFCSSLFFAWISQRMLLFFLICIVVPLMGQLVQHITYSLLASDKNLNTKCSRMFVQFKQTLCYLLASTTFSPTNTALTFVFIASFQSRLMTLPVRATSLLSFTTNSFLAQAPWSLLLVESTLRVLTGPAKRILTGTPLFAVGLAQGAWLLPSSLVPFFGFVLISSWAFYLVANALEHIRLYLKAQQTNSESTCSLPTLIYDYERSNGNDNQETQSTTLSDASCAHLFATQNQPLQKQLQLHSLPENSSSHGLHKTQTFLSECRSCCLTEKSPPASHLSMLDLLCTLHTLLTAPLTVRTVYCDGVYDYMHRGHLRAIQFAASLGTRLIVGVLLDKDVAAYKRSPVMTETQRALAVAQTGIPSLVLLGSPLRLTARLIESLDIDLVCHSSEYDSPDDRYYMEGRVRGITLAFPRTEGVSTTDLIKESKIKAKGET